MQQQIDTLQDENVTLKLKISDMESDLIDERHKKKINYDVTLESIKASVQEQVIDQKVSYEERLLASKEECHKYRVHIQGLEERMVILKE